MNRSTKSFAICMTTLSLGIGCVPEGQGDNFQLGDEPALNNPSGPVAVMPPVTIEPQLPVLVYGTMGTIDMAYDHLEVPLNQFSVLSKLQEEGPPEISARLHGCSKMPVTTVSSVLRSFGVDMSATAPLGTAGGIFRTGGQALGAPNFLARSPEGTAVTTAGATKLFDLFVSAAATVIQTMPTLARCRINGQPTEMFDAAGSCTINGISCLQGYKATETQQAICNAAITRGSTPQTGRVIAVAAIMAAANTCE